MSISNYTFRSQKKLGQNFLQDHNILRIVVKTAEIKSTDIILEIGPGKGAVTKLLLESAKKVIAVEKDKNLVIYLKSIFAKEIAEEKLLLLEDDILNFQEDILLKGMDYKLVANIPYNISGKIIKKFVYLAKNKPQIIVMLVQKEFAEKLRQSPKGFNNKIAVFVNLFGNLKFIKKVSKGCFTPIPKVDSQIIKISIKDENLEKGFTKEQQERVNWLLGSAFKNKRKKLINNLEGNFSIDLTTWREIFRTIGLDFNIRAEALSLENWQELIKKSTF